MEKILRARDDGEVGERVLRPIRNATRRMVFMKTENAMYEAVRRGGDDAEIARLARAASAFWTPRRRRRMSRDCEELNEFMRPLVVTKSKIVLDMRSLRKK